MLRNCSGCSFPISNPGEFAVVNQGVIPLSFLIYRPYSCRKPPFHALQAYIRFGHKHQVDHIVDEVMTFVHKTYPQNLQPPLLP
ncbi:hypothetical protein V8D89_009003 [Ganoderma adspersum]